VISAGGTSADEGTGIGVDGDGNAYLTGHFQNVINFGTIALSSAGSREVFVAKVDAEGNFVWARRAGGADFDNGKGIAVDAAGNSYVTGSFRFGADFDNDGINDVTSAGIEDVFLAKYDTEGMLVWVRSAGGTDFDDGNSVSVDGSGNVYLAGSFTAGADFNGNGVADVMSAGSRDIFIAKYDGEGTLVWVRSAGGTGFDNGNGVAVDGAGNVFMVGRFNGSADFDGDGIADIVSEGSSDIFLASYDTAGSLVWVRRAGGTGENQGHDVALDGAGNVYITGFFNGGADFDDDGIDDVTSTGSAGDLFVAKYDGVGALVWVRRAGGPTFTKGAAIAVDAAGNSYVTGSFAGSADFDDDGIGDVTSAGPQGDHTSDIFVATYDAAGTLLTVRRAGADNFDDGLGIAVDGSGNIYATGVFRGSADFDDDGIGDVTSAGIGDVFVVKYAATATTTEPIVTTAATFNLEGAYPNPFQERTILRLNLIQQEDIRVSLFDVLGREVRVLYDGTLPAGAQDLSVSAGDLPTGVYVVRATTATFAAGKKLALYR
jgi:hypothetical protein